MELIKNFREVNKDWLDEMIVKHYGRGTKELAKGRKAFKEDTRHAFKYSTFTKHLSGTDPIPLEKKHHYFLWFSSLENGGSF